jgi:hypothetical protein
MFYFSHDGLYLVKTLGDDEMHSMIKMLPGYYAHIAKNPNSLLVKYFGLYKLVVDGKERNLTVMANVFHTTLDIHKRFDLKGSTLGRSVGATKRGKPGVVHKDLGKAILLLCLSIRFSCACQFVSLVPVNSFLLCLSIRFSCACQFVSLVLSSSLLHPSPPP